ncbi:MAG: hypothetical protein GY948_06240 [Alphaproteobacteria bacterium]|nr:hypothetical protein [Alphaproteobacteria bacterium]
MPRPICALVGGGEGLGRALAGKFSAEGYDIALVSRSQKGSEAAAQAASEASSEANVKFSNATAAYRGSKSHPLYAIGKFGLRGLSQSLAEAYSGDGVHIVHVRLDCDLDVPYMRAAYGDRLKPGMLASPDDVATSYWLTHLQPKSAWSNEIELRPHTEVWTY